MNLSNLEELPETLKKCFTPQPTDIILCTLPNTLPKSGTTWLKALCFAIFARSQYSDGSKINPLLKKMPHDIVPVLEFLYCMGRQRDSRTPLLSTHVPYASLPKSIIKCSTCKVIYMCRDPKDVFISQWHFVCRQLDIDAIPLQEAFDKFCIGLSAYGPYWDNILGYWKASLEHPEKILFLKKYEDLQHDTLFYVKRIAEFMGYPFTAEEERQGIVQNIVNLCSFESLSNLEVNKSDKIGTAFPSKFENNAFFRKGKVGDWKNYLTPEMVKRLDQITKDKFNGSGITF
ncbi:LOW QUALITY PROTEIN: cytosolic sulfotransferase 17 [Jatropha curcas]|uniref:LOW QUALITY PROTEIN: cytosolic sulfotransferase 17 n=1 Tax=Jatropha curcas TaxID=180498 RepID=UPI0018931BA3|nr:LOW QUALITY PROTEIN: cytosolic sulfotransferase 17 [Jatropha curcas]